MLGLSQNLNRLFRGLKNEEGGSAIIEMAISCTVLFAMFFGIFEFSLASYTYHYVSQTAREGARYAIVRGSTSCINTPKLKDCNASSSTIGTYVKSMAYPGIDSADNMTVTTTWLTATRASGTNETTWSLCAPGNGVTCNLPGNMVNVAVTYSFPLTIPFVPSRKLNLFSTSEMTVQQ